MAEIFITQFDYDSLISLLDKRKPHDEHDKELLQELAKAKIVDPADIPPNVITMNSKVEFADSEDNKMTYWLVFPEDADLAKGKISILSPIGCALIGYKVNDSITLKTPKGKQMLTVKSIISQPEREGNYSI